MKEKPKIPITFIALMGSVIISQVGLSVYITALNWKVLEFSNSAFHTGVIATSMTLPQFLFSLAGGAIADNKEKLRSPPLDNRVASAGCISVQSHFFEPVFQFHCYIRNCFLAWYIKCNLAANLPVLYPKPCS